MLKFVMTGAAATAVMGTALGDYAARFAPPRRAPADGEAQAIREARPLLQRLSLTAPDAAKPAPGLLPAAASAVGAQIAPPPFLAAARTSDDAERALDCLAAAVYHEARSEGIDGERAVAQVVLNRVRDRAFPASVCGVVYQGSERSTGCQFTFTCDGSLLRPRNEGAWEQARAVAAGALAGEVYAPVGSATHYHADYVTPWWASSLRRIGAVGNHVFYRWPTRLERALTFRQAYAGAEPDAPVPALRPAVAVSVPVTGPAAPVRFGGAEAAGVRVHRFGEGAPTAAAAATGVSVSAGVRVHRGMGSAATGGRAVDGATIGAEDTI